MSSHVTWFLTLKGFLLRKYARKRPRRLWGSNEDEARCAHSMQQTTLCSTVSTLKASGKQAPKAVQARSLCRFCVQDWECIRYLYTISSRISAQDISTSSVKIISPRHLGQLHKRSLDQQDNLQLHQISEQDPETRYR